MGEKNSSKIGERIRNTIVIAKKEFLSLMNSRLVLIVLALYIIEFISFIFTETYPFNGMPPGMSNVSDPAHYISGLLAYSLCWYGSLLAIVLGFASISEEIEGKALNVLLVKPLYRDTIINGKLLGALGFLVCLFIFTSSLYIMFMLAYFGFIKNSFSILVNAYIPTFVNALPLVLILSILCFFLFYALSMLYTILLKNQSLSLAVGILSWIFLFLILSSTLNTILGYFFHNMSIGYTIISLSPYSILYNITGDYDLGSALANNFQYFFELSLYCFVALIGAYIVFLRRDVA